MHESKTLNRGHVYLEWTAKLLGPKAVSTYGRFDCIEVYNIQGKITEC